MQTPGADLAAEFIMLTAVRTGEARFMRVREIDFKEKLWTIPAIRMETGDDPDGTDFQVPLCDRAIAILKAAAIPKNAAADRYVLAGQSSKGRHEAAGP